MQHYTEGRVLVDLFKDLVERHPIAPGTARLWFEVSYDLLSVAWEVRAKSWKAMLPHDREELLRRDPRLAEILQSVLPEG